ncbi:unnamed protein product [Amoebophrya sp. A120]|nr:unnamed protein product [Amoebophrya sp. A120]|eukprot:GSA120T00015316001.1
MASGVLLSLVGHHQAQVGEDGCRSMESLTRTMSESFQFILGRPVERFVFTGVSGQSRVLLESDSDLQLFLKNHTARERRLAREDPTHLPAMPSFEVRLSPVETADMMGILFQRLAAREAEVQSLRSLMNVEREELSPFVRAVEGIADEHVPQFLVDAYKGRSDEAVASLNSRNGKAQQQGARVLALWTAQSERNAWEVWDSALGLRSVLRILSDAGSAVAVVERLLLVLARFASLSELGVLKQLCGMGAADLVAKNMATFPRSLLVQRHGSWFFGLLSEDAQPRSWLLNGSGSFLFAVLTAMEKFPSDLFTIRYGASVLQSISLERPRVIAGSNGIRGIRVALTEFGGHDRHVAASCLRTAAQAATILADNSKIVEDGAGSSALLADLWALLPSALVTLSRYDASVSRYALHFLRFMVKFDAEGAGKYIAKEDLSSILHAIAECLQTSLGESDSHALALLADLSKRPDLRPVLVRNGVLQVLRVAICGSHGLEATRDVFRLLALYTDEGAFWPNLGETVSALIYAMERHALDEKIQSYGAFVLGSLAADPLNREGILKGGGAFACLNALYRHTSATAGALISCPRVSIETAERKAYGAAAAVESAGVLPVPTALSAWSDTPPAPSDVTLHACAALAILAEVPACRTAILAENGMPLLRRLLATAKKNSSDELAKQLCKVFAFLVLDENCLAFCLQEGCADDLMEICAQSWRKKEVWHYASRALANLSNGASSPLMRASNGSKNWAPPFRLDVAESVVNAMREHGGESRVQEGGCELLCTLAPFPEWQGALVRLGAIQRIVQAMEKHIGAADVQRKACWALTVYAGADMLREIACNSNALEAVAACLREYVARTEADVCEQACASLFSLAVSAEARARLGAVQAEEQVLQCLSIMDAGVQLQALGAVSNLAVDPLLRLRMVERDAVALVLQSLRTYGEDAQSCQLACMALANLVHDKLGGEDAKRQRALETATRLLSRHGQHSGVLEQVCAVLCNVIQEESDLETFLEGDGVPVLLRALRVQFAASTAGTEKTAHQAPRLRDSFGVQHPYGASLEEKNAARTHGTAVEAACCVLTKLVAFQGNSGERCLQMIIRDGATELLKQVNASPLSFFDARICTGVLLRRLDPPEVRATL